MLHAEVQLQGSNTLRLPSLAQFFASPDSEAMACDVLADASAKGLDITVLGRQQRRTARACAGLRDRAPVSQNPRRPRR